MKDKFLIGEISKFFNISTDTLRYYEKIDLFKPDHDEYNHYRYYDIKSFLKLSRILFFKSLDISLEDIREYMKHKNIGNLLNLLNKKEEEIDKKIKRLVNLQKKIQNKRELLESIDKEVGKITVKKIPERVGLFLDMSSEEKREEIVEAFKMNEKYLKFSSCLIEGQVYTSISKENIENKIFNQFRYFIEILSFDENVVHRFKVVKENDYACITFVGPYREMQANYEKLINWIDENGYKVIGDSIEKNIVDYDYSDSENEYISEIQIPIGKLP